MIIDYAIIIFMKTDRKRKRKRKRKRTQQAGREQRGYRRK